MIEKNKKPDLASTLAALQLGETQTMPSADVFYGLSDLDTAEIAEVQAVWALLSDDYRVRVMQRLAEISEADYEMDYRNIGFVGLDDPVDHVREAAIDVLWEDESLEFLGRLVDIAAHDVSNDVRAAAFVALGRFILLGELESIPQATTFTARELAINTWNNRQESVDVRRRALEAIANCTHDLVPIAIREAYQSNDAQLKTSAIFAMGKSYDEQWEHIILKEIENDDPAIRYEATRAAGELELAAAVSALGKLFVDDDDREIQEAAVWSLGEIGGKEAMRILEAVLEQAEEANDEDMIEAVEEAMGAASMASGDLFTLWSNDE